MLLRSIYFTSKNFRGISRIIGFVDSSANIRVQTYSRFAPRHPVAIVNEDELFDVDTKNTFIKSPRAVRGRAKPKGDFNKKIKEKNYIEELDSEDIYEYQTPIESEEVKEEGNKTHKQKSKKVKDENKKIEKNISTKLYKNEELVSSQIMDLRSKKRRKKGEQILIEGKRFIEDAIEAGLVPQFIVYSRPSDIVNFVNNNVKVKMYKVPYRSIQLWSTLTTAPGIMGMFERPKPVKVKKSSLPLTIICDNIRDPGNMGSILRAAAGVGCEKVILTKGCVDFWDVKVLRSAAGAHFRVPIFGSLEWEEITQELHSDANVFIADSNADNYSEVEKDEKVVKEEIDKQEESEEQEELGEKEEMEETEKKIPKEIETYGKKKKFISEEEMERISIQAQVKNLPVIPYFAVDYTKNQVILIVGGETEGISSDSFSLVERKQGIRVNIPLDNKVDSLNAGMALGIVAFEVKRQFLLVEQKLNKLAQ